MASNDATATDATNKWPTLSKVTVTARSAMDETAAAVGSGIAAVRRSRSRTSVSKKEGNKTLFCSRFGGNRTVADSGNFEACPICLESLCSEQLGICLDRTGCRVCLHYFHLSCLQRVEGAHCPQCRIRFSQRAALESITENVGAWCRQVSLTGSRSLGSREARVALKAILALEPDDVDAMVDLAWPEWTQGEELLSERRLPELAAAVASYLPTSSELGSATKKRPLEDDSGKLEDGHAKTGTVCKCGQVHVRRGDRVRRGKGPHSDMVSAGEFGTVARVGENQETVKVKWDRSNSTVSSYTWPDPEGHVLMPVSFGDVADDVCCIQERTGLSSVAAEELLRRANFAVGGVALNISYCEEELRGTPRLYHRVRLLPDKRLVQQWFDQVKPCQCNRPACAGGVQWSSRAEKHLGREGLVLKMDVKDDTVLVATTGACNCQIWYPRLAVTPVYDLDLEDRPLFQKKSRVECRMEKGWEKGVVEEVCWDGPERTGPFPYLVSLDSGASISVPHVSLIRAA